MKEHLKTIAIATATVAAMYEVSRYAFSGQTRKVIWERAGGRSELSGETEHLMCSHVNHDKRNPEYDHPDNGILATKREEYLLHYYNEGSNGLKIQDNRTTLWGIWQELSPKEREGLPKPKGRV